jgi:DNA polymerase-3 subunit beta
MKFSISNSEIAECLQIAQGIIPSRNGSIFLRSLWIKVENQQVTFLASNGEVEYGASYFADVSQDGILGVHGRDFIDLLKKLDETELVFQLDDNDSSLKVLQGTSRKYEIPVVNSDWFTPISDFPEEGAVEVNGDILRVAIEKVEFCIDEKDDGKQNNIPEYISLKADDTKIEVCALNNNQVAIISFENPKMARWLPEEGLYLHKKFLNDLKKWLKRGMIKINITENHIFFKTSDDAQTLTIRACKGSYPQYRGLFESVVENKKTVITFNRLELLSALERLNGFTSELSQEVSIELHEQDALFTCKSQMTGKGEERLVVKYSSRDESINKVVFVLKQLVPILKNLVSKSVDFLIESPEKACVIIGVDDIDYKIIIMPCIYTEENLYDEDTTV